MIEPKNSQNLEKIDKNSENANSENFDYSQYARKMRLALSNQDMRLPTGEINHEYFLYKKGDYWSSDLIERLHSVLETLPRGKKYDIEKIKIEAKLQDKVRL